MRYTRCPMLVILIDRDGTRHEVEDGSEGGAPEIIRFRPDPQPRVMSADRMLESPPAGVDRTDCFASEAGAAWWRKRYCRRGSMVRYVRVVTQDERGQLITNEFREYADSPLSCGGHQ